MSAAASSAIPDATSRARALDVATSFVVQAPAGSGKTGLLVLRFLALLARVERPEAVLAITFTRKAAGEMRRRIVEALMEADAGGTPPEADFERERFNLARAVLARDAELGWGLLRSTSRLQVFTIDSFCARVVSATPLMSRLGSTPQVVGDATALYREAVRRTLSSSGREHLGEQLEILLERYEMGLDRLEDQLVAMLARREQWREGALAPREDVGAWVAGVEASFAKAVAAEVESLADGAEEHFVDRIYAVARASRIVVGADCAWPTLGEADLLTGEPASSSAWKQAAALLSKEKGKKLRTRRTKDADVHGGHAEVKQLLGDLVSDLADLPGGGRRWIERFHAAFRLPSSPTFAEDGRAALGAFLAVLRQAYAMLWLVFRERREVDFSEVAMGALKALDPGETLEKLDARLDHILVDEFQDTNILQCELLRGLTSGWQEGDGRTLFLVGDPMQSIYRFRKAEVGLFLAARSKPGFLGECTPESLALSVNFRSTRTVVGWVGRIFPVLLGDRDDATRSLVSFAPALPGPKAGDGPAVDFVLWGEAAAAGEEEGEEDEEGKSGASADKTEADAMEAAGLADLIAVEAAARRASGEQAKPGSAPIAVLVRARSHALPLLRALQTRAPQVRVRAPGLDWLADRTLVVDLEALTRALLHPGDRLAWLALLRSPWVGLSLGDITALVEPDVAAASSSRRATPIPSLLVDEAALLRVGHDGRRRVERLLAVVEAARRDLAVRSLDVAVRAAWLRLGGLAGGRERAALDALDAEAFFDLLSKQPGGTSIDLDDFARRLGETEAPVDAEADADVEIMTMHKAKGLEFDTVILPALGRTIGGSSNLPLAMETDPENGKLTMVAPRGARGREDADGDKYDFLQFREKGRGDAENLRLLYVAATRARRRLVLSATAARLLKKGGPASGSLLKALEPALHFSAARADSTELSAAGGRRVLMRLPASFVLEPPRPSVADRSVTTESPSETGAASPETFADDSTGAKIGIVYHAFVQRIAADGLEAWPPPRVQAERHAIEHALRSEGTLKAVLDEASARVARALVATLEDDKGRWIVTSRSGARSEWAVTGWDGRRLTSAQIDRTFVDGGQRWIVDYKTGGLEGDDADARARAATEKCLRYRSQLARYGELLAALEPGLPVRLGLFFPEWPEGLRWQDVTEAAP
ncbi:MAG: UvrD-helicase domain-containing protein [Candidatus Binatia bacterium]